MKPTPPADTENLAAEYWTDAFAACTTYLIDAARSDAGFVPCASRWLAAGLAAYDRDYYLLARWVEGIADLLGSEVHNEGWRAFHAEPAEGERLATRLAEVANELREAASRDPQSFGTLTGAADLANAASASVRHHTAGSPAFGVGPPGHLLQPPPLPRGDRRLESRATCPAIARPARPTHDGASGSVTADSTGQPNQAIA